MVNAQEQESQEAINAKEFYACVSYSDNTIQDLIDKECRIWTNGEITPLVLNHKIVTICKPEISDFCMTINKDEFNKMLKDTFHSNQTLEEIWKSNGVIK